MHYKHRKKFLLPIVTVIVILAAAFIVYLLLSPPLKDKSGSLSEYDNAMQAKGEELPQTSDTYQNEADAIESPALLDTQTLIEPPDLAGEYPAYPAMQPDSHQNETQSDLIPESTDEHLGTQPSIQQNETHPDPIVPENPEIPGVLAQYYDKAPEEASYFDLPETTSQLVVIDNANGGIRAHFFVKDIEGNWSEVPELNTRAWGGSNGIRQKQREGDKVTPVGQFPVLEAFYINNEPATSLDVFEITKDTYWIDDPDSVYYNKRVEGTQSKDWNSAEHMISYPDSYKYGFVIGYNPDCIPHLGSAVFFHVSQRSTAGCVGVSEEACLRYLAMLDKSQTPYILIVSTNKA